MDKMMKECMKPHAILHIVSGAGVGLLLVAFFPGFAASALTWGLVLIVLGIVGEFLFVK